MITSDMNDNQKIILPNATVPANEYKATLFKEWRGNTVGAFWNTSRRVGDDQAFIWSATHITDSYRGTAKYHFLEEMRRELILAVRNVFVLAGWEFDLEYHYMSPPRDIAVAILQADIVSYNKRIEQLQLLIQDILDPKVTFQGDDEVSHV